MLLHLLDNVFSPCIRRWFFPIPIVASRISLFSVYTEVVLAKPRKIKACGTFLRVYGGGSADFVNPLASASLFSVYTEVVLFTICCVRKIGHSRVLQFIE